MDNRYYNEVIAEMQPFLDEQGFKPQDDGTFLCDTRSAAVKYNEEKQMYTLSAAEVENGNIGEYSEINAWLFDDSQNAKDAAAVGIDFVNSLRKEMGIKLTRTASGQEVELPTITKSGSMTVTGFTKKMLDFYPALKDEYKNHIAVNGNFLYLNFFGEFLVPQIKATVNTGSKKQIKKLFDLLDDIYVKGDRETVNTVVAVVCAAVYNDENLNAAVTEALSSDAHFLMSYKSFLPVFAKNKKLIAALIK